VLAALQERLGARSELWGRIGLTACECLGPCFDGPNMVIYPEGVWYAGVTPSDVEEIVERHLVAGQIVDRLVYDWTDDE